MNDSGHYILTVSSDEIERLRLQAEVLAPLTRRALRAAGIESGGEVLDVGTGTGDVAFLVAELVGPSGRVHGVDIEAGMIVVAREDARVRGVKHTTFEQVVPGSGDGTQYDGVVARFVLAQQADQPGFLRQLAARVRPGGTLLIIDSANYGHNAWSMPPQPLYDELVRTIFSVTRELGHDHNTGMNFVSLFEQAGLPEPEITADWLVGGPRSKLLDCALLSMRSIFAAASSAGVPDLPGPIMLEQARASIEAASAQVAFQCIATAWVRL